MVWFPFEQSARFLADEAELATLTAPSLSCSLEEMKSALSHTPLGEEQYEEVSTHGELIPTEFDDASFHGEESVFPQDEAIAARIADAAEELARRRDAIGNGYPFTFDGTVITASNAWPEESVAYVFLLLLSADSLPGQRNGARHFEEVVTAALARYLDGESLRFGFPHRAPVPSHPEDAVNYLATRIGQRRLFTRQVKSREKDMGVDAVAWKRFAGGRPTKVVLLANCSTGANWKSKLGELSTDKWKRMIDFGCDPVQVFAVPWVPSREEWADIVDYGNMVLDRVRVASLLAGWDAVVEVRDWCKRRLGDATSV